MTTFESYLVLACEAEVGIPRGAAVLFLLLHPEGLTCVHSETEDKDARASLLGRATPKTAERPTDTGRGRAYN